MTEQQPVDLQTKIRHMSDSELQQFTEWLITERYRVQAEKTGVQMPKGDFMPVDGQKIRSFSNEEDTVIPSSFDPEEIEKRLPQMGQYNGNDGAITFVGPDGKYWVGLQSEANFQALKAAGFQKGSVGNIMNADCTFSDPEVQQKWEKLLDEKQDKPLIPPEEISQPAEASKQVSIYNPSPEEVKEYASKQWAEWGLERKPNFERDTREFFEKMITDARGYIGFPMNPQGMTDQEKELYAVYKEMAPKLGYSLGELQYDPTQEMGMAKISKIETEAASVATPIIEDWQSQLRQMTDNEHPIAGKAISQSYIDFVQSLLNQGISHDKIAAEIGHYTQEKRSTTVALAKTNQAVSTASTRQEITLGREAIGTSPEGLLNRVNQDLTRSASSKISFMANPEAVIDYLKTIELPLGSKIKAANTQIRGNQLSIRGVVGTKAGRLEFDVTYMQNPDGKLVVVGEPMIKTDWKLNLALKAKGYDIKDTIAHLDQIMAVKINQKVDHRWKYVGFRIAGNQLALDFKKK